MLSTLLESADGFAGENGARTSHGRDLVAAWQSMLEACRSASPPAVADEHTALFAAPGRAEVTPYVMHYVLRYENETPLVGLRAQLAQWGIARQDGVNEPEDHIAALCESMGFSIAVQHRPIEEQKEFFERYLYRGAIAFCDRLSASSGAHFYRPVAVFARAFFELEREAFAIEG